MVNISVECHNKLKEIRARHNVTQEQLARFLGIGVVNYRRKEKGIVQFKEKEMYLCVEYFNHYHSELFQLDDLFGGMVVISDSKEVI